MIRKYVQLFLLLISTIFCSNAMEMEKEKGTAQQLNVRFVSENKQDLIIIFDRLVLERMGLASEDVASSETITNGGKIVFDLIRKPTLFAHAKNTRITLFTIALADKTKWKSSDRLYLELFFPENGKPELRLSVPQQIAPGMRQIVGVRSPEKLTSAEHAKALKEVRGIFFPSPYTVVKNLEAIKNKEIINVTIVLKDNLKESTMTAE